MKHYLRNLLIGCTISFAFFACSNEETPTPQRTKEELILGKWQLSKYEGKTHKTYTIQGQQGQEITFQNGIEIDAIMELTAPDNYKTTIAKLILQNSLTPSYLLSKTTMPESTINGKWRIEEDSLISDHSPNAYIEKLDDSILILKTETTADKVIFGTETVVNTKITLTYTK